MKKKHLPEIEKDKLAEKIASSLGAKERVVFAYIFGSFLTGRAFQDIDIGIYISNPSDVPPLKLELEFEAFLENEVRLPVDVRIINRAPVSFAYNVLKGGRVVVDKDKDLRADFEGLIYKKYSDLRHLRREYLREIVHAPV